LAPNDGIVRIAMALSNCACVYFGPWVADAELVAVAPADGVADGSGTSMPSPLFHWSWSVDTSLFAASWAGPLVPKYW
jgi:hypothetical protein